MHHWKTLWRVQVHSHWGCHRPLVTATSNGYSAAYDAAGNQTCRALTSTTTCNGASPTGQQLSYDIEGRLSSWQNQATGPTQTVNYLYDGEGTRVAMQSTVNGTTTLTAYIGSLEEVQTTGSTTQTTTYYAIGGTLPTSIGFTGQLADSVTGLDGLLHRTLL